MNLSSEKVIPLLAIPLLLLALGAFAPVVSASSPSFSFNLLGPNTATGSSNTLALTGSGSFSTSTGAIGCSGAYEITNPSGAVVDAGTFVCTSLTSFTSYGGPSPGFQGGHLVAGATLVSLTGSTTPGTLAVTCLVHAPPGTTFSEGITFVSSGSSFTTSVVGATLFHTNS